MLRDKIKPLFGARMSSRPTWAFIEFRLASATRMRVLRNAPASGRFALT
jgi:hypothetical protein